MLSKKVFRSLSEGKAESEDDKKYFTELSELLVKEDWAKKDKRNFLYNSDRNKEIMGEISLRRQFIEDFESLEPKLDNFLEDERWRDKMVTLEKSYYRPKIEANTDDITEAEKNFHNFVKEARIYFQEVQDKIEEERQALSKKWLAKNKAAKLATLSKDSAIIKDMDDSFHVFSKFPGEAMRKDLDDYSREDKNKILGLIGERDEYISKADEVRKQTGDFNRTVPRLELNFSPQDELLGKELKLSDLFSAIKDRAKQYKHLLSSPTIEEEEFLKHIAKDDRDIEESRKRIDELLALRKE